MTENIQTISTLHNLLDYEAGRFVIAEVQLKKSLSGWISIAGSLKLKNVLQKYQDFIEDHIQKMESFYQEENIISLDISNRIMKAFIDETEEKLNSCTDPEVKDACLLSSVQMINHYKISYYGTAAAFAKTLEMEKYASAFHQAEVNEKQIDDRLSQLAEYEINNRAKTPIVLQE